MLKASGLGKSATLGRLGLADSGETGPVTHRWVYLLWLAGCGNPSPGETQTMATDADTTTADAVTSTEATSTTSGAAGSSSEPPISTGSSSGLTATASSSGSTPSRLQHFGFVGVSCMVDDPYDAEGPRNYVDEVAAFTNIAHLCPLDIDITAQAGEIVDAGGRAFIDLTQILFEAVPGEAPVGTGSQLRLRSDAATLFGAFVEASAPVLDSEHVAAFYLVDEPIWNGTPPREIAAAATLVDDTFPNIPIMVIEAYPVVEEAVFPEGVDWVGFDRYLVPDPSSDPTYLAELETVRARATDEQDLVIILDAQWFSLYEEVPLSQKDMEDVARHTYKLAMSRDDVVAVIGYTWPGGLDVPEQRGARSLPEGVQAAYREIGQAIVD
ncbi:MAG: hypothetical protein KUG77_09140 [Nannocystaceae bacterium]|nr:hypothetical protein [Nannocystaceae bacterium]